MQVSSSESIAVAQKCDTAIDMQSKCHSISKQIRAFSGNKINEDLQEKLGGGFVLGLFGLWFLLSKSIFFFIMTLGLTSWSAEIDACLLAYL